MKINRRILLIIILVSILVLVSLLTSYYGSTDVNDYANTAKYFAGDLSAKLRISHSAFYGLVMSPFLGFFENIFVFKIASIIFLLLLIYSVYYATKNKNAFWLMLLSPIIWYMGPWINPIQISSLLFFWSYYFIKKFDSTNKSSYILLSGILAGVSWAFWDAVVFFIILIAISFFYNKKTYQLIYFLIFVLIGISPKLLLDQITLGFAFSGILRYISGQITSIFFNGIYGSMKGGGNLILNMIILALFLPLFTYKLFSKENLKNFKYLLFIFLSILLILKNTQIRYILILTPIIIYELAPQLNPSQFKKQIYFSIIMILLVLTPYFIQINHSTNISEFSSFISSLNHVQIYPSQERILKSDIDRLIRDYPNKTFVVGNKPDDYDYLAFIYWGKNVKEFVSIQDYNLWFSNSTVLFQKKFMPVPKIQDRRQIWISGGISKNENDKTEYKNITLGIGVGEQINLENFKLIKKYGSLFLSEKI